MNKLEERTNTNLLDLVLQLYAVMHAYSLQDTAVNEAYTMARAELEKRFIK